MPGCKSKTETDDTQQVIDNHTESDTQEDSNTQKDDDVSSNGDNTNSNEVIDQDSILDLLEMGSKINEISYDLTYTSGDMTMESKYWQKGNLVKIENDSLEGKVVTIYNEDEIITYYPDEKIGSRYTRFDDGFGTENINVSVQYLNGNDYSFVENTSVNGEKCIVVNMTDEYNIKSKLWISTKYGIITKVQSSDEGGQFVSEIKNISTKTVSDSSFNVPEDIQFEDGNSDQDISQENSNTEITE